MQEHIEQPDTTNQMQMKIIYILIIILSIICLYNRYRNPLLISKQIIEKICISDNIVDKINPNTAEWQSLARLPGIGAEKAKAIVAYRQAHANQEGKPCFHNMNELNKVKGIGPVICQQIAPYIIFEIWIK